MITAEYTISGSAEAGGGLIVHVDDLADVLNPKGFDCDLAAGWGDLRLTIGGTEVAFALESFGWHVVLEGKKPLAQADSLVAQVAAQLQAWTGQPTKVTRIT